MKRTLEAALEQAKIIVWVINPHGHHMGFRKNSLVMPDYALINLNKSPLMGVSMML